MEEKEILEIIERATKHSKTWVDLSYNGIKSLPPEIGNLTNLRTLNLRNNELTSLPTEIGLLENLVYLNLCQNQLSALPAQIVNLKNLMELDMVGNPLKMPPIEIVNQGIEAIRNYFELLRSEDVSRVYEAKLLIVGEGGVGKTCLMTKLMAPNEPIDLRELTTEGVEINQWTIGTDKTENFRINFWDFGGQEIYHATHQFFLTKRSLYLFVWTARKDDDLTSFDYWLNVIKLLSDNSPVIVVLNKIDERIKSLDEQSLQDKFKNIVCFDRVSAIQGQGMDGLSQNIRKQITQLPHIGTLLPSAWIHIRRRLEELDKNYISFDEYNLICSEFGLNEEKAEFLSRYYHDLGVFLHFLDNAVLREIVFLKPDWATNAVYKVVDTRKIQENYGKFHFDQLKGIWTDYPKDKFAHMLELMKKFELCFQIPKTQTYIVPELLRPGRPEFKWDYAENLRFEYRYEFMPAGIITRFIVRTHDICKKELYWKNGVILEREKSAALVISDRLNRRIRIRARGDKCRELLAIIRREIDYIHKTLNCPYVKEMIPCVCCECDYRSDPYFHNYYDLIKAKEKGKSQIECKKSFDNVSIETLLGDYERMEDKERIERFQEDYQLHIEINPEISPHIEVSPTIEQTQVIEQSQSMDLSALAKELQELRKQIRSQSDDSLEADVAAGEIAKAEKAAKEGDESRAIRHLKAAGKWAFDFATSVGSSLVAEVMKKYTGM